jgi:cation/acetate symporter
MTVSVGRRAVNPRLGTYFGIFASAFAAIVLMILLFEQLGVEHSGLRIAMLAIPLLMYAAIGVGSRTSDVLDFFAAGRRVPAVYTGVVMAVTAIGGTGLLAMTGLFFVHGFDAWCIGSGIVAGFVVMGVLIAPFLRKFGGFTVASYLGRRFDSRLLRIVAAALLTVPALLVLSAELDVAARVASRLAGVPQPVTLAIAAVAVAIAVVFGGLRGSTWTGTAQCIAVFLAILVPAGLIAVLAGNLPVPQLSHGPTLRVLGSLERQHGMAILPAAPLAFSLAGTELTAMAQRFAIPFQSIGPVSYVIATLTIMAGIAVAPWLLIRVGATPGVYETRKSTGWATFTAGIVLLTLAAMAVFMRDIVMEQLSMRDPSALPQWFGALVDAGYASVTVEGPRLSPQSFQFARDSILFALPMAASFPDALLYLAMAGAVAAGLAGATAATIAVAHTIAEDIVAGTSWEPLPDRTRLGLVRIVLIVVPVAGAAIAGVTDADPFRLAMWALAITGATAFPVIVLSIWWKRLDEQGALAAMVVGFATSVLAVLFAETTGLGLDGLIAGSIGIPASLATALIVSTLRGAPGRPELELVAEIRIPGGETFYDRESRRYRQKQRQSF